MKISNIDINLIKENPDNPRTIGKVEFDKLVKSIKDFPQMLEIRPIVINKDMIVLGGNMRLRACKHAGLTEVPIIKAEDLTPEQQKEFIIKDNVGFGAWDWDKLGNDFDAAQLSEWGLDALGIEQEKPEAKEDDFTVDPDGEKNIFIKLGDLIELGRHRVLCGDSTEESNYNILMLDVKADLLLTDPPYGVSYSDKNTFLNAFGKGNKNQAKIENDELDPESLKQFLVNCFSNLFNYLKDISIYYCFMPQGGDQMMTMIALNDSGFQVKHELIWLKNNHVLGRADYNYKHEPICYGWKKEGTHKFYGDFSTSILEFDKPTSSKEHPTMKPVALIARLISNSSVKDSCVLDPFLGSGTTLIASDQLKRTCYGMEISPKYCQVIIKRYKQYCEDNNQEFICKINGELIPEQYL